MSLDLSVFLRWFVAISCTATALITLYAPTKAEELHILERMVRYGESYQAALEAVRKKVPSR